MAKCPKYIIIITETVRKKKKQEYQKQTNIQKHEILNYKYLSSQKEKNVNGILDVQRSEKC